MLKFNSESVKTLSRYLFVKIKTHVLEKELCRLSTKLWRG